MNCEYFIRFIKDFQVFKMAREKAPFVTEMRAFDRKYWFNYIDEAISKSKVFEVDEDMKKLLLLSNPPIDNNDINLPFDYMFIDVSFSKDDLIKAGFNVETEEIIGILVSKGNLLKEGEIVGTDLRISICARLNDEIRFETNISNMQFSEKEDYHRAEVEDFSVLSPQVKNIVHRFFLNFLNFLNNPEVEYVEQKRTAKNQARRAKQGKPMIPSSFIINIYGKMKIYLDEARKNMAQWHFNYRFWVKGHFRQLRDERYKNKKRMWILPFVKGSGILVDKSYKLKDEKKDLKVSDTDTTLGE